MVEKEGLECSIAVADMGNRAPNRVNRRKMEIVNVVACFWARKCISSV